MAQGQRPKPKNQAQSSSDISNISDHLGWNTGDDGEVRNIFGDDRASTNQGTLANCDPGKNSRIAADTGALLHPRLDHLPVSLSLLASIIIDSAWVNVVRKHHPMAHKHAIFNGHPFTDKSVRRDLASFSNKRVLLNFNEG